MGTHADSCKREVTESEVQQFQRDTNLIVLPTSNVNGRRLGDGVTPDGRAGIAVSRCFALKFNRVLCVSAQTSFPVVNSKHLRVLTQHFAAC